MNSLFKSLLSYAKSSEENYNLIVSWRDAAIASIAAGNGNQLLSGSGNGTFFSIDTTGMKTTEWFDILQQVIDAINNGTRTSITQARF